MTAEHDRLADSPGPDDPWRAWGPYLSGRQWGTVREDYSATGNAWDYFPFDDAHRRAFRWGEDGLGGLCDRHGFLNLAPALWNGHDDRLKERLFGLTNDEGNHGEDVKEYWWAIEATPTHSYGQWLYRYPHAAYPYDLLRRENRRRGRQEPEFELADTGLLTDNRFVDLLVTHAKAAPDDICVLYEATNHGPEPTELHLIPQLWFRNTWAWGGDPRTPSITAVDTPEHGLLRLVAEHAFLGRYQLSAQPGAQVLVCDNETDAFALWGQPSRTAFPKTGIDLAVVHGHRGALNPAGTGTKAGLHYRFSVAPGQTVVVRVRLHTADLTDPLGSGFDAAVSARRQDCDDFYAAVLPSGVPPVEEVVVRRAYAGLMWGKQVYRYQVREWLDGDPAFPPPPASRLTGRNAAWPHLALADVISMPDEWEYPWFAAWDLAFHCVTFAHVDPAFAKDQLLLMCRAWAQHPNGQLPAYEWKFGDTNPPVHAWACWQVYLADGARDRQFLVRVLTKLLLNVGWWVNWEDKDGSDLFEGGFLGMDNISVFDRSRAVLPGWRLEQSDATSWMAFYCLGLLRIALELARDDAGWQDVATTLLERFLAIAEAVEAFGSGHVALWDDADGFFYDVLVHDGDRVARPVRVASMVGLVPLLAVATLPGWVRTELPGFAAAVQWRQDRYPELMSGLLVPGPDGPRHHPDTLTLVDPDRYPRILARLFDEAEFLSPYGVRSLSAAYRWGADIDLPGGSQPIRYVPGDSDTAMFGGNSNWRGPVWFPVNALLVDALREYAVGAGIGLRVDLPTRSGHRVDLTEAADTLRDRLIGLFRPGPDGRRPGTPRDHPSGPLWDHPTFSEYFHGDTGAGLGASHQTGWTALVAHLILSSRR